MAVSNGMYRPLMSPVRIELPEWTREQQAAIALAYLSARYRTWQSWGRDTDLYGRSGAVPPL